MKFFITLLPNRHLNAGIKEVETNHDLGTNGSALGFPPNRSSFSCIKMNGTEVFRFAVGIVPQTIEASLAQAGLNRSDIDWLLLHQVWTKTCRSNFVFVIIIEHINSLQQKGFNKKCLWANWPGPFPHVLTVTCFSPNKFWPATQTVWSTHLATSTIS